MLEGGLIQGLLEMVGESVTWVSGLVFCRLLPVESSGLMSLGLGLASPLAALATPWHYNHIEATRPLREEHSAGVGQLQLLGFVIQGSDGK